MPPEHPNGASAPSAGSGARLSAERHLDVLLDEALEETFPASDPLALPLGADRPVRASSGSRREAC